MSIDLQDLFDQAGRDAPAPALDGELIIRRGRRSRARRRVAVSTGAVVGAGVVVLGAAAAVDSGLGGTQAPTMVGPAATGSSPHLSEGTTSPTPPPEKPDPASQNNAPVGLEGVSLPDPAPGFPIRRGEDRVAPTDLGRGRGIVPVATFLLAAVPETVVTDDEGSVSGFPNGPEVTMMIGEFPMPQRQADDTIEGHEVVASPTVAGTTGYVTTHTEKGKPIRTLYFSSDDFTVTVTGIDGVTTGQLVDLGNALAFTRTAPGQGAVGR